MFKLKMHCDRISSPRKEVYYAIISLHVQEFIVVSHGNNSEHLHWATTKHQVDPRHKTGKIRKYKRRFCEELFETKQESLTQLATKQEHSLLYVF